jgi:mono/diheme cytochrome c family protein
MRTHNTIVLISITLPLSLSMLAPLSGNAGESAGANSKTLPAGRKLYDATCAACHPAGGNIINPKKPVKGSAMLASKTALKSYLEKPTASMPPFPAIAGNKDKLENLYSYVKTMK